jgi:hypothetical protein
MGQLFIKQKKMVINQRMNLFENGSSNFNDKTFMDNQQLENIILISTSQDGAEIFESFKNFAVGKNYIKSEERGRVNSEC